MNCHFRPNRLTRKRKRHPLPQMYAYVDESHPHQTHFSIPFPMIVVWIYLCVRAFFFFFWNATLEPVRPVRENNGLIQRLFVLAHRPQTKTLYLPVSILILSSCRKLPAYLLPGIHTTICHSIRMRFCFPYLYLQSCALLCPSRIALSIARALFGKDVALKMPLFLSCLVVCTSIVKVGGKWLIQSSVCS